MTHHDIASVIVSALQEGPDYGRMGASMISLLHLSEEFRQAHDWTQAHACCDQLKELAKDPAMRNIPDIDTTYASGIAEMTRGAIDLSRNQLGNAGGFFTKSQSFFHAARTEYSEAVALFALGIVHQEQQDWKSAISELQCSLTLLRKLDHPLKSDVCRRLADVRNSIKGGLKRRIAAPPSPLAAPSPQPTPAVSPAHPPPTPLPAARQRRRKAIPIVARIAAGAPTLTVDDIEGYIEIDEDLAESVDFALKVEGDSMTDAAILDGDLVLIEKREDAPPNGQIAAVIVTQTDTEATLKRFYHEGDHIRLKPENDSYPLIILKPDEVPDNAIRALYQQRHPKRLLEIYSGTDPQIAGWVRALIREEVK